MGSKPSSSKRYFAGGLYNDDQHGAELRRNYEASHKIPDYKKVEVKQVDLNTRHSAVDDQLCSYSRPPSKHPGSASSSSLRNSSTPSRPTRRPSFSGADEAWATNTNSMQATGSLRDMRQPSRTSTTDSRIVSKTGTGGERIGSKEERMASKASERVQSKSQVSDSSFDRQRSQDLASPASPASPALRAPSKRNASKKVSMVNVSDSEEDATRAASKRNPSKRMTLQNVSESEDDHQLERMRRMPSKRMASKVTSATAIENHHDDTVNRFSVGNRVLGLGAKYSQYGIGTIMGMSDESKGKMCIKFNCGHEDSIRGKDLKYITATEEALMERLPTKVVGWVQEDTTA